MKSSSSYRFAALTLVLSFVLGMALPGACYGSDGGAMPGGHGHSQEPCAAPCHFAKAPIEATPALLLETDRLPAGPDASPAGEAFHAVPAPLFQPRVAASSQGRIPSASPPVRLHVFHAVFLN